MKQHDICTSSFAQFQSILSSLKVRCNTDKIIRFTLEFTKWKSNGIENLMYRTL